MTTPDDLVERVALKMRDVYLERQGPPPIPDHIAEGYTVEDFMPEARAAIRIALEEAAKVAESYEPRCDTCPRGVAAAIRAMIKD